VDQNIKVKIDNYAVTVKVKKTSFDYNLVSNNDKLQLLVFKTRAISEFEIL
jgi:hypothetical protein